MANVHVNLGFTKNLGNFESARVEVGFEDTVREDESVEQAQRRVYDVVEKELISKLRELVEEIDEVNKRKNVN